ncbi:single-stranded DNA-binding protein [Chloroflexi bacterium TSY]|nr:single-stranded DNA-binding protein [Chloroflexi bacterium TSY]
MYQQLTLVGNLGHDPEMRYTPNGTPVTSFSLAVNRSWTDHNGDRQERTTWFRISIWNKQAEVCAQYLTKGRQVLVIGEVNEARPWIDQEGNARASLEVTARQVQFLGSAIPVEVGTNNNGSYAPTAAPAAAAMQAPPPAATEPAPTQVGGNVPPGAQLVDDNLFNDDIPF